ncbi:MAG: sulfurtransferase [Aquabacterium sp.]
MIRTPSFAVAAAYRFVDLPDAAAVRDHLLDSAAAAALKGTVLVATEGINFTLAGEPGPLQAWLEALQADARFAGLDVKHHGCDRLPFQRLRVKLKREIIRMNQPMVRPQAARAPAVDAATLQRWLDQGGRDDQGREVVLLDTRNGFEVDAGAFVGAIDWRLAKFSDFPRALAQHRAVLQGKTVVSYCTGGIRCEKAALWMREAGVEHALQLDGGILRYFEATQGAPHWRGQCFVFDEREQLDTDLRGAVA